MANLLSRVRNLYDDHQDREKQQVRQEGYQAALHQTRDALLSSALETLGQWRQDLQAAGPNSNKEAIHARYEAHLQGLNDAFTALRQADSSIVTHLDVEQFRQSAIGRASYQQQEQSWADKRTDRGYEYTSSY